MEALAMTDNFRQTSTIQDEANKFTVKIVTTTL